MESFRRTWKQRTELVIFIEQGRKTNFSFLFLSPIVFIQILTLVQHNFCYVYSFSLCRPLSNRWGTCRWSGCDRDRRSAVANCSGPTSSTARWGTWWRTGYTSTVSDICIFSGNNRGIRRPRSGGTWTVCCVSSTAEIRPCPCPFWNGRPTHTNRRDDDGTRQHYRLLSCRTQQRARQLITTTRVDAVINARVTTSAW